jgi:hypothetical protein
MRPNRKRSQRPVVTIGIMLNHIERGTRHKRRGLAEGHAGPHAVALRTITTRAHDAPPSLIGHDQQNPRRG